MTGIEHYLSIFTKAVFIENIVLAYFLGLCSFLAISKKIDASVGIGLAVIVVLTITAPINWFLWEFLLDKGALVWISSDFQDTDLGFLKLIVFISVIAAMVVWLYFFQQSGWGGEYTVLNGVMPVAFSFGAGVLAMLVVSLVTSKPSQETVNKFFPDL